MSLPESKPLPDDINDLPPARQRQIRRQPRSASPVERQILLASLMEMTVPKPSFFLFSLLGFITLISALYFDDPVILIVSAILYKFITPILGLSLVPATQKWNHGIKSLISLLILLFLTVSAGVLTGYLQKTINFDDIPINRFLTLSWLDLAIVSLVTFLGVLIFLREGKIPHLLGVILAYEILLPLAAGGFGFSLGAAQLWPASLLVGFTHLMLAILLAMLLFMIFGFGPKHIFGWLFTFVFLVLTVALLLIGFFRMGKDVSTTMPPIPRDIPSPTVSPSTTPKVKPSITITATALAQSKTPTLKPSFTPSPTLTNTITNTPEPTTYFALVDVLNGAVIRESPTFDAPVIGYLNDGASVEILGEIQPEGSSMWYRVRTAAGETGWLLASLTNTQTPTPPEN